MHQCNDFVRRGYGTLGLGGTRLLVVVAGPAKGAEATPAAVMTVLTIRAGESVGLRAVLVAGKCQA